MKLLLAYDGFEHSQSALEAVAAIAAGKGADVTILSVVPPSARGSKSGGHVGLRPHAGDDGARAREYLRERGIDAPMKIGHGDPAAEIVAEAEAGGYDAIVTGSRNRGTVGRLLLGSVSAEVARRAPCPVLVAPARA